VCLYAIPSCVAGILIEIKQVMTTSGSAEVLRIGSYAIGAGVQLIVGVIIISMSKTVAGWMFKSDED
jgi:hypothetical protein